MPLPAPNLDDRRFQDLVDDAKRFVQERCPEWTDHNVSDPGVTLIEAAAQMIDQLIYRVNRVPDLHYVKFLDLIGVELLPPAAARGDVTFWLSAPQPQTVVVRAETEVATPRTDVDEPIHFTTVAQLDIVSCSRSFAASARVGATPEDKTLALERSGFTCFSEPPVPGDALLVGLSAAVPSCAVALRMDCVVKGIGIDPRDPPLVWEAWDGHSWEECEVDKDDTGGLNRPGDIIIHVPPSHLSSVLAGQRAGWLRCRVVAARPDQASYTTSPEIKSITADTVGGTVGMVNAEVIRNEFIGVSDGSPAQRFALQRSGVVPWEEPSTIEEITETETIEWTQVDHFADSTAGDTHFRVDPVSGDVIFGPAVRAADGSLRSYGAVPAKGSFLRLMGYRVGGGRRGNVARGQIRVLKTSVPYVGRVENRGPAIGGAEGETVADAKLRAPLVLRSRGRAVTAEDFELLAREAAPDAARVRCAPAAGPDEAGGVRVFVVPHTSGDELGRIQLDDLMPPTATLSRISSHLNERRMVGTRLLVTVPTYVAFTAVVSVKAAFGRDPDEVRQIVLQDLYRFFHPIDGGRDGTGWPFGRPVQEHDLIPVLQQSCLDTTVRPRVHLFRADVETWDRTEVERVDVPDNGLLFSYDHQVILVNS